MIKYQLKILNRPSLWLGIVVTIILPFFVTFKNLNLQEMVFQSERFLPLIGMIILPDAMSAEGNFKVKDIVYQLPYKHSNTFLIRLVLLSLACALLVCFIFNYALVSHSQISIQSLSAVIITTLFAGLLGLFFTVLSNIAVGYLLIFTYYTVDLMTKGKYFGILSLFNYHMKGIESKYILLLASFFIVGLLYYIYSHKKSL